MMYHALAVREGGDLVGFVRSAIPLTVIEERLADLRRTILSAGLAVTMVAMLLGLLITRHLTAPLLSMTEVADAIV
jgi:two-component system phosphate regulon sensor histidine kinase PhoR